MIARTWQGETTAENAEQYLRRLQTSVLPELRGIPGFLGPACCGNVRREASDSLS